MTQIHRLLISVTIATCATVLPSHRSQAALLTWDMQFFDRSGSQIGTGFFSYDDALTTRIPANPVATPPYTDINSFAVHQFITQFAATLQGVAWSNQPWQWINDQGQLEGQISSRYGLFRQDRWIFGDVAFNTRLLSMSGGLNSSTHQFVGGWSQILRASSGPGSFTDGSWLAAQRSEAVPEPLTVLGLGAFGLGAWWQKRRSTVSGKISIHRS